ncbi:MAG TPA: hypothetical protein VGG19_11380 [Tepidisphaeraceae bacterium]|jgi:hypothetical protein
MDDPMNDLPEQQVIPVKQPPVSAGKQLVSAIEERMLREPQDLVKCVHLFDDYFRCNWWAPAPGQNNRSFDWGTSATHHVRKSCFLKVSNVNEELTIEEI